MWCVPPTHPQFPWNWNMQVYRLGNRKDSVPPWLQHFISFLLLWYLLNSLPTEKGCMQGTPTKCHGWEGSDLNLENGSNVLLYNLPSSGQLHLGDRLFTDPIYADLHAATQQLPRSQRRLGRGCNRLGGVPPREKDTFQLHSLLCKRSQKGRFLFPS